MCWAFKKGRMFLLGHPKFHVVTDHRPLLRVFGDKPLADIENPRLAWLKSKTLAYSFDIHHIEGKSNPANVFTDKFLSPEFTQIAVFYKVANLALSY